LRVQERLGERLMVPPEREKVGLLLLLAFVVVCHLT
jgi:hypothetical protein